MQPSEFKPFAEAVTRAAVDFHYGERGITGGCNGDGYVLRGDHYQLEVPGPEGGNAIVSAVAPDPEDACDTLEGIMYSGPDEYMAAAYFLAAPMLTLALKAITGATAEADTWERPGETDGRIGPEAPTYAALRDVWLDGPDAGLIALLPPTRRDLADMWETLTGEMDASARREEADRFMKGHRQDEIEATLTSGGWDEYDLREAYRAAVNAFTRSLDPSTSRAAQREARLEMEALAWVAAKREVAL